MEYLHFDPRGRVPHTLPGGQVGIHVLLAAGLDNLHPLPSTKHRYQTINIYNIYKHQILKKKDVLHQQYTDIRLSILIYIIATNIRWWISDHNIYEFQISNIKKHRYQSFNIHVQKYKISKKRCSTSKHLHYTCTICTFTNLKKKSAGQKS